MDSLIRRAAALECYSASCGSLARDFRVIEMQIARAEEKVLRLDKASLARPDLNCFTNP